MTQPAVPDSPLPLWRRPWFRLAVGLLALASLVYLLRGQIRELGRIRNASWPMMAVVAGVYLVSRYLNGQQMRVALSALGYALGRLESFVLMMIITYTNLLIPRVGLGTPAVYLKLRRGVKYVDFVSQMLVVAVLQMIFLGIAGPVCLLVLWRWYGRPVSLPLAGAFGLSLVVGVLALLVRLPEVGGGRLARLLRQANESWRTVSRHRPAAISIVVINAAVLVLRTVRVWAAFAALGIDINPWGAFVASGMMDLMLLVNLTPGALGFREGAVMLCAPLLGITPDQAFIASVLDRVVWSAATVVVGQVGLWTLIGTGRREQSPNGAPAPGPEVGP